MRELKFRAWDTANKRWATESDFKEVGLFVNYYIDGSGKFELQADVNECGYGRFEIVEFTGLHDKNGKEIYEGDMITTRLYPLNDGRSHDIYYKDGCFRVRWTMFTLANMFENTHNGDIEVIGNIYENPELLK